MTALVYLLQFTAIGLFGVAVTGGFVWAWVLAYVATISALFAAVRLRRARTGRPAPSSFSELVRTIEGSSS